MIDKIFTRITYEYTTKKTWDILKEEFRGTDKIRFIKLQYLITELEMMNINEGF